MALKGHYSVRLMSFQAEGVGDLDRAASTETRTKDQQSGFCSAVHRDELPRAGSKARGLSSWAQSVFCYMKQ